VVRCVGVVCSTPSAGKEERLRGERPIVVSGKLTLNGSANIRPALYQCEEEDRVDRGRSSLPIPSRSLARSLALRRQADGRNQSCESRRGARAIGHVDLRPHSAPIRTMQLALKKMMLS
jgi:hypothetical protein